MITAVTEMIVTVIHHTESAGIHKLQDTGSMISSFIYAMTCNMYKVGRPPTCRPI
jgi:hypothetical protein